MPLDVDADLGNISQHVREKPVTGLNLWPLMTWFVLYAPMKWPPGVKTVPELDQVAGAGHGFATPAGAWADAQTAMFGFLVQHGIGK